MNKENEDIEKFYRELEKFYKRIEEFYAAEMAVWDGKFDEDTDD